MPEPIFQLTEDSFLLENSSYQEKFDQDPWRLLYQLALDDEKVEGDGLMYLVHFASLVLKAIVESPDVEFSRENISIDLEEGMVAQVLASRPFFQGEEYLDEGWILHAKDEILSRFREDVKAYDGTIESYFASHSPSFKVADRLFFHLVENKGNELRPFAFLATYANEKTRHVPLANSIKEYAKDQDKLLKLLAPLSRIAESSAFIKGLIDSGEIMKPIGLTADEALEFLKETPLYEGAGIYCRIPNFWKRRKKSPFKTQLKVNRNPSLFGLDSLLDFQPQVLFDGKPMSRRELEALLSEAEGLRLLKGQWVEVQHKELQELLARLDDLGEKGSLSLLDVLRREMGLEATAEEDIAYEDGDLSSFLRATLSSRGKEKPVVPEDLRAVLRPYQTVGFEYLSTMDGLGLGCCLADDMGLGKTLQVIALIGHILEETPEAPVLLVVPTSLVGNWMAELEKFLPSCPFATYTESARKCSSLEIKGGVTITTYGLVGKLSNVMEQDWRLVVLDEAQAIKNSTTAQAKAVHSLTARSRIALTGTPVENSAMDLWSLFDFLDRGLLSGKKAFQNYLKELEASADYSRLRKVISPFVLRRMKTDRGIIQDLPEKLEEKEYPSLTKLQTKLYEKVVSQLSEGLETKDIDDIGRKGLVLSSIIKLKQICNHPDQYAGQESSAYLAENSGKFLRLEELCQEIRRKQERVLVFTQFREIIPALDDLLARTFSQRGLTLDGSTPARVRSQLVEEFNAPSYCPYMVLSLKAGGVGLNLTSANHVVHFDRWWNPAVENQATDRAFRIGQKKNVMVHTFITKGTLEEKIDLLLEEKKEISNALLASSGEKWITELSKKELLELCALGRKEA